MKIFLFIFQVNEKNKSLSTFEQGCKTMRDNIIMIRVLKSGVQVFWTCSVVHKNELYVYGGDARKKGSPYQIAKARFPKKVFASK